MKGPFILSLVILNLTIASSLKCHCTGEDNLSKTCDNCLLCYIRKDFQTTISEDKCFDKELLKEIKEKKTEESRMMSELALKTEKSKAPECKEHNGKVTCLCSRDNCNEANIVPINHLKRQSRAKKPKRKKRGGDKGDKRDKERKHDNDDKHGNDGEDDKAKKNDKDGKDDKDDEDGKRADKNGVSQDDADSTKGDKKIDNGDKSGGKDGDDEDSGVSSMKSIAIIIFLVSVAELMLAC